MKPICISCEKHLYVVGMFGLQRAVLEDRYKGSYLFIDFVEYRRNRMQKTEITEELINQFGNPKGRELVRIVMRTSVVLLQFGGSRLSCQLTLRRGFDSAEYLDVSLTN
jgi:hypothetical protein